MSYLQTKTFFAFADSFHKSAAKLRKVFVTFDWEHEFHAGKTPYNELLLDSDIQDLLNQQENPKLCLSL